MYRVLYSAVHVLFVFVSVCVFMVCLVKLYDAVVHSLSLFPCFLEWFQY